MRRLSPYSQPETPPRGRSDTRGRLSQRTSHRTHLSQRHGLRPDMEPRRQVLPQPCQAKDFGDQTFATIHVGTPAWTGHIAGATLRQHRLRDSGWGWPNRSTRRPQDRGHHRRKLSKWSLITSANDCDQRLATKGLSTPPDFIASPLHRVVLPRDSFRRDRHSQRHS